MSRRGVRRAQGVVPFGVGAIVDFEDEALMAAGLDAWPEERDDDRLVDERLATKVGVRYFRQPPAAGSFGEHSDALPYQRFPYWHFCPRCRALSRLKGSEPKRPRCDVATESPRHPFGGTCAKLPIGKRRGVLPLRFVLACPEGHIEDFPWDQWVHVEKGQKLAQSSSCAKPSLYFYATDRGGLSGLVVHCVGCDKKRSLIGAIGELKGFKCSGARPWLGPKAIESCTAPTAPQVLQRGASNIYFPFLDSSLLIPPFSKAVRKIVDDPKLWETITAVRENGKILDSHIKVAAVSKGVPFEDLKAAVLAKDAGEGLALDEQDEAQYRFDEYRALSRTNDVRGDTLVTKMQDVSKYDAYVRSIVESVVLVESLSETRALTGFSRLDGPPRAALSLTAKNWLPAYRVQGEGIFLTFKSELFERWESGKAFEKLLRRVTPDDTRIKLPPTPELLAIHTLAHLLILELSFEAGYGASSLRERLYCAPADSPTPMRGLLIYTAAGDSEGTLGGLVRLGKPERLKGILRNAITRARWCSADPVCRESQGQGLMSLNLAACHACALLPETSCETGNRLLDRLSLVGIGQELGERRGLLRGVL